MKILKIFFKRKNLHRFNDLISKYFYSAIRKIHNDYNDDASNIWKYNPKSATLIKRFLQFEGAGIKIATMAANILVREFKIKLDDYYSIDILPDVHLKRIFKRIGLFLKKSDNELIYAARELYPEYPGIFDLSSWKIGRNSFYSRNPDCQNCYLFNYFPKII